jgi:hypothetical protein
MSLEISTCFFSYFSIVLRIFLKYLSWIVNLCKLNCDVSELASIVLFVASGHECNLKLWKKSTFSPSTFGESPFFLPELQNRANHLPQFLKLCVLPP